jgi:hypothetical protein
LAPHSKFLLILLAPLVSLQDLQAMQFVGQINTPYVLNLVLDTKNIKQSYLIAATKLLGSKFELARFNESLVVNQDGTYRVQSVIEMNTLVSKLSPLDKVIRSGEGKVYEGFPQSINSKEQRGSSSLELSSSADYAAKKINFSKGRVINKTIDLPVDGVIDINMLSYLFLGESNFQKELTLNVVWPKGLYSQQKLIGSDVVITFAGQKFPGIKYSKVKKNASDNSLDIWIRKSDGKPMRILIGLSAKYGVILDVYPASHLK